MCSCVVAQRKEWVLLSVGECGEKQSETSSFLARVKARRGLEKSTPDCWLFLCTIPRQRALHGRQQAIHKSSQYPSLSTSSFPLLLFSQCFPRFTTFQFVSVNLGFCECSAETHKCTPCALRGQKSVHLRRNTDELLGCKAAVARLSIMASYV